jgi:hypothetical protein
LNYFLSQSSPTKQGTFSAITTKEWANLRGVCYGWQDIVRFPD